MIEILFNFGGDFILVKVDGNNIKFSNSSFGAVETDISGLKLNHEGVIKEFPDLKDNDNWKSKAIERFKKHIGLFKTEEEKANYIVEDLKKHGYIAKHKQRKGFRKEVIE